jgi:hypothetical protein
MEKKVRCDSCGASFPMERLSLSRYFEAPRAALGWAVSKASLAWFVVTIAFVVGTICSEYTRGVLVRVAGVHLPPRTTPTLPRPGIRGETPSPRATPVVTAKNENRVFASKPGGSSRPHLRPAPIVKHPSIAIARRPAGGASTRQPPDYERY